MDEWRELFRQRMREAKPGDAWSLRTEELFEVHNLEPGWKKALQERAHASFLCSQCYHTWSSYQVVILFHMYWERPLRQGQVMMRLFRQQCQRCSSVQKEKPQFTGEEMESVIQRLILDIRKKCYRERVHRSELVEVVCEGKGPHKTESCEACQMGLHKGHHGRPDDALHHGRPDDALHQGKPEGALHHGRPEGALHHGRPEGALHHGRPEGALHHGRPEGALHHGRPEGALHHGKPDGALHHGRPEGGLHHGRPEGALHHGKPDDTLHHGKPDGALHQGRPEGALHHGRPDGALHHGKADGARHHGRPHGALRHEKPEGALHHGKADGARHHGKPGSALYCGSSQSPSYSCTSNLPSYEISPIHTSWRRSLIQPPSPPAAPTCSRPCCVFCICCIAIPAACVIFVLVAYWKGWF